MQLIFKVFNKRLQKENKDLTFANSIKIDFEEFFAISEKHNYPIKNFFKTYLLHIIFDKKIYEEKDVKKYVESIIKRDLALINIEKVSRMIRFCNNLKKVMYIGIVTNLDINYLTLEYKANDKIANKVFEYINKKISNNIFNNISIGEKVLIETENNKIIKLQRLSQVIHNKNNNNFYLNNN